MSDNIYSYIPGGVEHYQEKYKNKTKPLVVCGAVALPQIGSMADWYQKAFFYRMGRDNPNYLFHFVSPMRVAIDKGRDGITEYALAIGADFLFFWDTDACPRPDTMKVLLGHMERDPDLALVAALYYIRGEPFPIMAFRDTAGSQQGFLTDEEVDKAIEEGRPLIDDLWSTGIMCDLIRLAPVKDMDRPFFKTGERHTEDVYFCYKLRTARPDVKIALDPNLECGHQMPDPPVVWRKNVKLLREYYKNLYALFRGNFDGEENQI